MIDKYKAGQVIQLPDQGSWPATVHVVEKESLWALKAALAARRPLLVRGEPGCGKSQLARAAAFMLGRAFLSEVVHARQEHRELQWHFDAVARLGEAQVLAASQATNAREHLAPEKFLGPGLLWWAFDWTSAQKQSRLSSGAGVAEPEIPDGWTPEQGCVVLIDEIDKAETDLPNGLLETLGNGAFPVPHKTHPVKGRAQNPPLVVITTNEERELPAAFVRRCLVLNIELEEDKDKLIDWLAGRGKAHLGDLTSEAVRRETAALLYEDRTKARDLGLPVPGQAEYLDLLRAVAHIAEGETEQREVLDNIRHFALVKHKETS
ncbi:MAG: AAA family ATPase [Acidobacteriota bacterium]|nr:AAA family ATPase [Acidobacteriota bacterium]